MLNSLSALVRIAPTVWNTKRHIFSCEWYTVALLVLAFCGLAEGSTRPETGKSHKSDPARVLNLQLLATLEQAGSLTMLLLLICINSQDAKEG